MINSLFKGGLVIAVFVLIGGCSPKNPFRKYDFNETISLPGKAIMPLNDLSKARMYKASVKAYKNYLSGMLIFKKIGESNRVVFTSEMGMKFFDFEFKKDTFIVHSAFDKLNNKHVIKTLQEDIGLLLNPQISGDFRFEREKQLYKVIISNEDHYYYQYSKEENSLQKLYKTTEKKSLLEMTFSNYNTFVAQEIDIVHQNFDLNIHLSYINR